MYYILIGVINMMSALMIFSLLILSIIFGVLLFLFDLK
nr:MAG TPA: hypothetical protein [Caudoviricetes sp.]